MRAALPAVLSFGTELKRFARDRLPRLAILAIILVPLLYGAMYLWAFWNPTHHLDRLPVALVNEDVGASLASGPLEAGAEVADDLTSRGDLDWEPTTAADAADGVKHGRYYFSVTIPSDFSESIASLDTDAPVQAKILVTYNDSNSFLASTLGSTAMGRIVDAVSTRLGVREAGQVFLGLQQARDGLVTASDGAAELADGAATLAGASRDLAVGADGAAQGAATADDGAQRLASGAAAADDGARAVRSGAQASASGANTLATGAKGLADGAKKASDGAGQLAQGAQSASAGADTLAAKASDLADGARDADTAAASLAAGAGQAAAGASALATGLGALSTNATTLSTGTDQLATGLTAAQSALQTALASDPAAVAAVNSAFAPLTANAATLSTGAAGLATGVGQAATQATALSQGADAVNQGATALASGAHALAIGAGLLDDGAQSLATGAKTLATASSSVASGTSQVAQGSGTVASGAQTLASGSRQLATGAGTLSEGLGTVATGATRLADGTKSLTDGTAKLADGAHQSSDGADKVAGGATDLKDGLAAGVEAIPDTPESLRDQRAEVLAAPVTSAAAYDEQAEGFGEGFAPMFIALALFLGAFVVWMLMRPVPERLLASPAPGWRVAIAGYLPAAAITVAQVLVIVAVVKFALGLAIANLPGMLLFGVLVSLAFLALQQMLVALFGSAPGKLAGLALLMLQLVTCGGTYPVQTEPALLRWISPAMPMTWAVRGFRLLITGGADHRLALAVAVLVSVIVGSMLVTSWRASRLQTWTVTRLHPVLAIG